jgi:hypothetical protein
MGIGQSIQLRRVNHVDCYEEVTMTQKISRLEKLLKWYLHEREQFIVDPSKCKEITIKLTSKEEELLRKLKFSHVGGKEVIIKHDIE